MLYQGTLKALLSKRAFCAPFARQLLLGVLLLVLQVLPPPPPPARLQ
jgi:hypothetical protein